ncbi:MAG: diaminopimelate decarboxylase [Chloroflexota bacterium]|nr:diaminopimelate decarboxylase [Chloroflexota bacterium]
MNPQSERRVNDENDDIWPVTAERGRDGELLIGGVSVNDLAARFGTPLYVFDEQTLRERARLVRDAFTAAYPRSRVVYAAKALLNLAILRILHDEGLGLDVVSGGELYAGLRAGIPAGEITFHGNNKSEDELAEAVVVGVGAIVVDNEDELACLGRLSGGSERPVPIMLRLNPGVDVHTHAKIRTGIADSKFGFPIAHSMAERAVAAVREYPSLDLLGYHAHIGSQLFDATAYLQTIDALLDFAATMRARHGVTPRVLSPGGGFGIAYLPGERAVDPRSWARLAAEAITAACARYDLPLPELVVEPGRSIVGPAGVALYRVGATKRLPGLRTYVAVDGGMADNIRPALYGARYTAVIADREASGAEETVTIAGKYCESGDVLIEDISLPPLAAGDLLAIPAAGAYCLSMASNYNLATRPAAVLVNDGQARLIRRRERYEDVIRYDAVDGDASGDEPWDNPRSNLA